MNPSLELSGLDRCIRGSRLRIMALLSIASPCVWLVFFLQWTAAVVVVVVVVSKNKNLYH